MHWHEGYLVVQLQPSQSAHFLTKVGTILGASLHRSIRLNPSRGRRPIGGIPQLSVEYATSSLRPKLHTVALGIVRAAGVASPRYRSTPAKQPNQQNQPSSICVLPRSLWGISFVPQDYDARLREGPNRKENQQRPSSSGLRMSIHHIRP